MNTIRAFIAVEIDLQTKQKISNLVSSLEKSNADVKWITKEQMHLTLKFLGNVEQSKIQEISNVLKSIADNFKPFSISLSNIGGFPNLDHPRVIWVAINKNAGILKNIAEKIDLELEKSGLKKDSREFKSHLTLGRVRSSKNMAALIKLIKETAFSSENDFNITKLILFRSALTPKGATYTVLSKNKLTADSNVF